MKKKTLSNTVTQLGGAIFLALKWVYDESKIFEVHVGELCDMFKVFCAPHIGPKKSKKTVKICTFLDFLTPKCVQYPLKHGAHTCPSSMTRAREIGLSKGSNWSRWWPLENGQNDHFFPKNPLFWTFWPLNVPQTSQNVSFFKIPVLWPVHAKSEFAKILSFLQSKTLNFVPKGIPLNCICCLAVVNQFLSFEEFLAQIFFPNSNNYIFVSNIKPPKWPQMIYDTYIEKFKNSPPPQKKN